MRNYPLNSPQAAGRILALVLIADGHVCRSEIDTLARLRAEAKLGLPPGGLAVIVRTLCEDLMHGMCTTGAFTGGLDAATLDGFFSEVNSPALREHVLDLARAAVHADLHLADGEALVFGAAARRWGLPEPEKPLLEAA
jgi:hypothetical protein